MASYIGLNMQNENLISLQLDLVWVIELPFTFSGSKIQNYSETKGEKL